MTALEQLFVLPMANLLDVWSVADLQTTMTQHWKLRSASNGK